MQEIIESTSRITAASFLANAVKVWLWTEMRLHSTRYFLLSREEVPLREGFQRRLVRPEIA
jgi:hypothetical protein